MRKNKSKITGVIAIISLIAVALVSGILAYLTSTDTKTNEFTIGSVKIKLLEPAWNGEGVVDTDGDGIPNFAENVAPNAVIPKDPQIKNTGENSAYVYLKVTVPVRKVKVASSDGTLLSEEATDTPLFKYTVNSEDWTEITSASEEIKNDSNEVIEETHVYYYKEKLEKNQTTSPLFENVTFANIVDEPVEPLGKYVVQVDAYAIQSENLDGATIEGAYAIYVNQNSNNE